jgi:hypothetical protein
MPTQQGEINFAKYFNFNMLQLGSPQTSNDSGRTSSIKVDSCLLLWTGKENLGDKGNGHTASLCSSLYPVLCPASRKTGYSAKFYRYLGRILTFMPGVAQEPKEGRNEY